MIQTFLPDRICLCFPFPEFFFDLLIGFFRLFEVYGKPEYKNDYPALLVELKWNQNAQTALTQIKTKNDEQEEQKIIKEYDNKEIKLKNTKKESYKITYFLYKVRENDTYESIAKIFSVDAEDVKKINNYENLYPGKLVRLKK